VLDLSDDWRDLAFAGGVDRRAGFCQQLAGHSVDDGGVPRQRPPWTRPRPLAMSLLPRGDGRVNRRVSDRGQVLGRP
jgi:hypothetical protein